MYGRGSLQFFLDPAVPVVGWAVVIMSPAFSAMEMRKSWISWRLRSDILMALQLIGYEWMEIGMGRSGGVWLMVGLLVEENPAADGPASDLRSLIDK